MEKPFYISIIAILETGVWNPTQGRTSDGRDRVEEDEVSLTTVSWESHRTSRVPGALHHTPGLQQRQSHVAMVTLLTSATMFTQNRTWRERQDVMMVWQGSK